MVHIFIFILERGLYGHPVSSVMVCVCVVVRDGEGGRVVGRDCGGAKCFASFKGYTLYSSPCFFYDELEQIYNDWFKIYIYRNNQNLKRSRSQGKETGGHTKCFHCMCV